MSKESLGREVSRAELLGLTPEDEVVIEIRLALHRALKESRARSGLNQTQLATRLKTGQSRIAAAETGAPGVSLDFLLKAMLATGATPQEIGGAIGNVVVASLEQSME